MPHPASLSLSLLEGRDVPATVTPFPGSPLAVGVSPGGLAQADFDGDGDTDIAVSNFGSNNAQILFNDGSGAFTATYRALAAVSS